MNIDALEIASVIICGFASACTLACIAYGIVAFIRADRRSRSQLRRSLGTMEAGK